MRAERSTTVVGIGHSRNGAMGLRGRQFMVAKRSQLTFSEAWRIESADQMFAVTTLLPAVYDLSMKRIGAKLQQLHACPLRRPGDCDP